MRRWVWLLCGWLAGAAVAAPPQVRVEARLAPKATVIAGATLNLEVDLLVDSWFVDAPVLPTLELPGAVVTPPTGEAQHLNERRDGSNFFGLRYTYAITPLQAQRFEVPALAFTVRPGPGGEQQTVNSEPLAFEATAVGAANDGHRLVAADVQMTQALEYSHQPLRVGDTVTRRVQTVAKGTQAMLLPAPAFAEVAGLKRYVQTPSVTPLGDGRGGVLGGQRQDSVTYVVTQAGRFSLPAIDIPWWHASTGGQQHATLPGVALTVEQGSYTAPFSLRDDLKKLRHGGQVSIAGHALLTLLALALIGAAVWFGRHHWQRALRWLRAHRQRRHAAWLASERYAWRQALRDSAGSPPRLEGAYLWVRRATGRRTLSSSEHGNAGKVDPALLALLQTAYAAHAPEGLERNALRHWLVSLRGRLGSGAGKPAEAALRKLNPRHR